MVLYKLWEYGEKLNVTNSLHDKKVYEIFI